MFGGLSPGMAYTVSKTISESDVYLFAGIVGDLHPNHVDAVYAAKHLGRRVAHGALLPGFISRCAVELIGNALDETGYAAQQFTVKCLAPVFIGDTIYTIRENLSKVVHNTTMGKLKVSYSVYKGEGELVLYAEHLLTALYRNPADFADEAKAKMAEKEDARG